ncbi:MAG: penicillin-binding protein 2 [Oscillospiraceae bacterium]|jgi:penicillin-binding protein 2|nr:penicillin-binding protein 2 [Oscillospiraceae bacterium]
MAKRAGIVFFLFVLCLGGLGLRLMKIPFNQPVQNATGSMSVVVDRSRGAIYDRNGLPLVQTETQLYAAVKPTAAAIEALRPVLSAQNWEAAAERLSRGSLVVVPVDVAQIPCPDIEIFTAAPRYSAQQLAPHLIGYLKRETGRGVSGLEKSFDPLLEAAAGELRVRLAADALGRSLTGAALEIERSGYCSAAGVKLTLDAGIQAIAEESMAQNGLAQGAVVVLDAQTGDVLALASTPAFDPNDIAASLSDPAQPFFNRALGAYPVGSTFKCFIAAAALEQGCTGAECFTCTGALEVGGRTFRCNRQEGHGTLDLTQALSASCNLYFIQLAQQLEKQPLLDLMALFGFGESTELAPELRSAQGNLPGLGELALPGELANFSFGQGKLLGTPLQMAAATACLANGGVYRAPRLIQATVAADGSEIPWPQAAEERQVIRPATAQTLRQMMITTVEQGSGRGAKPEVGSAGGKTATAQSGSFDASDHEILRTGFTGFFPAENPRYVVTVFCENGISGSADCSPVFKRIANVINARGE